MSGDDFAAWQATRRRVDDLAEWGFEGPGFVYASGVILENAGPHLDVGKFGLIIERCEWWGDDLGALEKRLYETWVVPMNEIIAGQP